jgi:hypothetical protein
LVPFVLKQFELGGRFHLPLPKMVPRQMEVLRQRLESLGFAASGNSPLRASRQGVKIFVNSSGLCSSNEDLSDVVAPALPEILALEGTRVPFKVLRDLYFASERRGDKLLLRLSPRLESESYWDELRSTGDCALAPDERVVYSRVLSLRTSLTPLVTDFPVEGSAIRRIGRRQYYDSRLEPAEAASTLRGIGSVRERNTYLPRHSILSLSPASLSTEALRSVFEELGDWCFLSLK